MTAPSLREMSSNAEIEKLLGEEPDVVLYFTATWCGPCRRFKPQLEVLAAEHPRVKIVAIYEDNVPEAITRFDIQKFPTCIFLKNGCQVGALYQAVPPRKFLEALLEHGLAA